MKPYLVFLVNKNLPNFCIISLFPALGRIAPNTFTVLSNHQDGCLRCCLPPFFATAHRALRHLLPAGTVDLCLARGDG